MLFCSQWVTFTDHSSCLINTEDVVFFGSSLFSRICLFKRSRDVIFAIFELFFFYISLLSFNFRGLLISRLAQNRENCEN